MLEVLIAMLVGTIGLLGTIAVQQAIITASKNANDAAVAMRLATQKMEELSTRTTDTAKADQRIGLAKIATPSGIAAWMPTDATNQPVAEYVDAEGTYLRDGSYYPRPPLPEELGRYRWRRQWKVVDTGLGLPYVISVVVSYENDVGATKTTRLDLERRKSW